MDMNMENSKYTVRYKVDKEQLRVILAIPSSELSSGAKLVLLNLIQRLGGKNHVWPKQETIGKDVGLGVKQVGNHLKKLLLKGYIQKSRGGIVTKEGYKPTSNRYFLDAILIPYRVRQKEEEVKRL